MLYVLRVFLFTAALKLLPKGKYGCLIRDDKHMPWYPISARMGNLMSDASTFLLISVILSTIYVISLTTLTKAKTSADSDDMSVPEDSIEAWFFWGRWVVVVTVLSLVYGMLQSINVLADIYYLKFPHPWLEQLCYVRTDFFRSSCSSSSRSCSLLLLSFFFDSFSFLSFRILLSF